MEESTMLKKITQAEYDAFNAEQKKLVKLLGIKVTKKFRNKNRKLVVAPKEYKLKVIEVCSLCESVSIKHFLMLKAGNKLYSTKVSKKIFNRTPLPQKTINQRPITCKACPKFLDNTNTKREVIGKYLKQRRSTFNKL
jgi:hypothetical protein